MRLMHYIDIFNDMSPTVAWLYPQFEDIYYGVRPFGQGVCTAYLFWKLFSSSDSRVKALSSPTNDTSYNSSHTVVHILIFSRYCLSVASVSFPAALSVDYYTPTDDYAILKFVPILSSLFVSSIALAASTSTIIYLHTSRAACSLLLSCTRLLHSPSVRLFFAVPFWGQVLQFAPPLPLFFFLLPFFLLVALYRLLLAPDGTLGLSLL